MEDAKIMTKEERANLKELVTTVKVITPEERQVLLNIAHDLLMIRRMGLKVVSQEQGGDS